MKTYKTNSANETSGVAGKVAEYILGLAPRKKALVVGLTGELGAGKTTFIKALIRSMGVKRKITSPTFVIMRRFGVNKKKLNKIFHIDAYRAEGPKDLSEINLEETLSDPQNLVLVEWADKIKEVLPKDTIWVKFSYGKERDQREITIN